LEGESRDGIGSGRLRVGGDSGLTDQNKRASGRE
jgi:hypothetical protein